jgi:hypothetical protein
MYGQRMTTLVSWISIDSRAPAALYIASDSRLTWATDGRRVDGRWDLGRKVFAARTAPEAFGFSGDVAFASPLLGQITDLIDMGALTSRNDTPEDKATAIERLVHAGLAEYPAGQRRDFTIFYSTRSGSRAGKGSARPFAFHFFTLRWSSANGWSRSKLDLPAASGVVATDGSGRAGFDAAVARWAASDTGGTSRAVFGAFCDALASNVDPRTGGAPQLVRVYPSGPASPVGVIWRERRYLLGQPVDATPPGSVEWRNETFEICDPVSMGRRARAKQQPKPRGL